MDRWLPGHIMKNTRTYSEEGRWSLESPLGTLSITGTQLVPAAMAETLEAAGLPLEVAPETRLGLRLGLFQGRSAVVAEVRLAHLLRAVYGPEWRAEVARLLEEPEPDGWEA